MDSETLYAQLLDLLATFDDLAQQATAKTHAGDLPLVQGAYYRPEEVGKLAADRLKDVLDA